mmetsp:Transcript_81898/g.162688  ORF Transcript_81898/g.162688 Transcript_81898/m.162688 type:complete len:207 (+) Transcript_81898:73-693(+)
MVWFVTLVFATLWSCSFCWIKLDPNLQTCPPGRKQSSATDGCLRTGPCDPDDPPPNGTVTKKLGETSCTFDCDYPYCNKDGGCHCINMVDVGTFFYGCSFFGCFRTRGDAVCVDRKTLQPIPLYTSVGEGMCVCKPGYCTLCGACTKLGSPLPTQGTTTWMTRPQPAWVLVLFVSCLLTAAAAGCFAQRSRRKVSNAGTKPLLHAY